MWSDECCPNEVSSSHLSHHHHHHFAHYSQQHQQCFETSDAVLPYDCPANHMHGHAHCGDQRSEVMGDFCHNDVINNVAAYEHVRTTHCPDYCDNNGWSLVPDVSQQQFCHGQGCAGQPDYVLCNQENPSAKSQIYSEIASECEHLLARENCEKCTVRDAQGVDQSIPLNDLVDIVLQTAENIRDPSGDVVNNKREQNKAAAAKYRDRQKARWTMLRDERVRYEERNQTLREEVERLEKEVADMRKKILGGKD